MKAQQTLRRPANWQDFESLCKVLWGEIWNCPEIQKNGRLGQEQSGVDVFGIPSNDDAYYGIQCKGKSEYNDNQYEHPQFSEKELENEIEKARTFSPPLKKFYLATTALNDAKIQAFVRQKNIEHRKEKLFEVHLFCWETIVDLIDENKRTYDYYVKSQNYKSNKTAFVSFENGQKEISCYPKFKKEIINFILPIENGLLKSALIYQDIIDSVNSLSANPLSLKKINKSYFGFSIKIHNTGKDPIEEYKLLLNFKGNIVDLNDKNDFGFSLIISKQNYFSSTRLSFDTLSGRIIPPNNILVPDDTFSSEKIFIKTPPEDSEVLISWKLLSKDYQDEGVLTIKVIPKIVKNYKNILVENRSEVRREVKAIEDYFTDKEDSD